MTPTELVASVHALAAQVRTVSLIMNGLMVLLALAVGVTLWRAEQRRIAERRVCDRLAQEADPEGWAQRQARQAQVAALVEEELARMRQAALVAPLVGTGTHQRGGHGMRGHRRQAIRDAGLIQCGPNLRPEKLVSYDAYNAGEGPQPVVCGRCSDGPAAVPSVRDVCVKCFAAVWVSRTTEAAMTHMRQPEILCMDCIGTVLKEEPS